MDGYYEMIVCPNCGSIEKARVECDIPFAVSIHDCTQCGYTITESQWKKYNGKEND